MRALKLGEDEKQAIEAARALADQQGALDTAARRHILKGARQELKEHKERRAAVEAEEQELIDEAAEKHVSVEQLRERVKVKGVEGVEEREEKEEGVVRSSQPAEDGTAAGRVEYSAAAAAAAADVNQTLQDGQRTCVTNLLANEQTRTCAMRLLW